MANNYWFEVAAFILEIVIGYMLFFRRSIVLPYNKIYRKLYYSSLFSSAAALIHVLIENYIYYFNKNIADFTFILNITSMVFFYAHILCCVFFAFYEYHVLSIRIYEKLTKFLLYLPTAIAITLISLNPVFHTIFYISPTLGYQRRPLIYLLYVIALYYLIFIVFIIKAFGQNIRNDKRLAFSFLPYIPVAGTILQFFFPQLAIESFFMTLLVLVTYITIESPSDYTDIVTGLQNKDALFTNFSVAMSMKKPVAVITLTIERIEAWDKEFGTDNTNSLIINVANFISHLLKNEGIYSLKRGKFAIYVALENSWANIHMSEILIDRIEERFKSPFDITAINKVSLSKRICVYNCPKDVDNAKLLHEIMQLESTAKLSKDKTYITIDDIDITVEDKERLISSKILNLYEKNVLYLSFLPELNTETNVFDSIKTEITMHTAEIGYVPSRMIISVAEKYGLIIGLYNYILESLFKMIRDKDLMILGIRSVEIIIPISILLKKNEVEKLINLAAKYDIPPKLICFELSKNSMLDYDGIIVDNMRDISNAGFRFILENYGNGYTNASALLDMPINAVTIDKVLTRSALTSELAANLMDCTIEFLKEFGLHVKADHIETKQLMDYSLQLGCDYLQGYYFSNPLMVDDLTNFLKKEVCSSDI